MLDLRRNGELEALRRIEERKAIEANFYFGHLGSYMRNQLGLEIGGVTAWDEDSKKPNTISKISRVGKILVAETADVAEIILNERYFQPARIKIVNAGNSSKGIDRETGDYIFTIEDNPKTPQIHSYQQASDKLFEEYNSKGLQLVQGLICDYIILLGNDPATNNPFFIEAGNIPIRKRNFRERLLSSPINRRKIDTIL
jgi:hypothetical protein